MGDLQKLMELSMSNKLLAIKIQEILKLKNLKLRVNSPFLIAQINQKIKSIEEKICKEVKNDTKRICEIS